MSVHVIKMPDLGEGIAEVELVAWHVKPGDTVLEDQVLADVMTDKANVEIPSPVAGQVLALGGEVGQMLAVGSELIRIELAAAGQAPATPAARAPAATAATSRAPAPVAPPRSAASPTAQRSEPALQQRPIASPAVRARAWELGIDLKDVVASGTAGRIVQDRKSVV